MSIQGSYDQWSKTYDADANRTRDLDQQATREALASHRYPSILELGCGTGKNTQMLAQIGDHVTAMDFSEGMLARAGEKLSGDNVTFTKADITQTWPCASQSFDLIVCNLVLEHIRELAFIFAEASRTLRQGGQFFISELHPYRQYQGTTARFQQEDAVVSIPAYLHHVSEFVTAAEAHHFALKSVKEWWHETDQSQPPRLLSLLFSKGEEAD